MNPFKRFSKKLLPVIGICTLPFACNNSREVPFPEKDLGYAQPVSAPLVFNKPTKVKWKIVREGGVNPVLKKLDMEASPALTYDSNRFQPFLKAPDEINFDIHSIPEKKIDLAALPSKKIQFKTTLLPAIPAVNALKPVLQKNKSISIADLGQAQGLPASFVTHLHRDKDGLMLVASKEGLFRYDGQQVRTLFRDLGVLGIIGGVVEDRQGRIWYVKTDNTLGVIDPKKGTSAVSNMLGGFRNNITTMSLDQHGYIWFYNQNDKAVSIVNPETGTYRNLSVKNGLADTTAFQVLEDSQKNIWISGGRNGLTFINPEKGTIQYIKKENGLCSDTLTAINEDKNGHIWVGSPSGGLNEIDLKAGKIKHYTEAQGVGQQYKFHLFFDSHNQLWVTEAGGILILDLAHKQYRALQQKDGISSENNISIEEDVQGRIWLGGNFGLNIIDQNAVSTRMFGSTQVISIMQDVTGNIWVATDKGLRVINPEKNQIRSFTKANGLSDNF
ncbi:MAG TPA: two-component regulator propeller domain-containing protein, partial [Sediminibacterium sp.]|nr:two-component regulator propeller domain-containing protein [Sediminibacterium sp.]